MQHNQGNSLVVLRGRAVTAKVGLSRSTIYSLMKAGSFPKPIHLSPRTSGWLESDINAFIQSRISVKGGV